jgi:hypothetical protein
MRGRPGAAGTGRGLSPWIVALLLGTVATPAGVVFAWLAPRPLDAVVALPLVLVDIWAAPAANPDGVRTPAEDSAVVRLLMLALGIGLTWLFYVLVARALLRISSGRAGDSEADDED